MNAAAAARLPMAGAHVPSDLGLRSARGGHDCTSRSRLMLNDRTLEYGSCSRHASRMASETCGRTGARQWHAPDLTCTNADAAVNGASPASCAAPLPTSTMPRWSSGPLNAPLQHAAAHAVTACLAAQTCFHAGLRATWSQILSGCPSLTDSEVKRKVSPDIVVGKLKSHSLRLYCDLLGAEQEGSTDSRARWRWRLKYVWASGRRCIYPINLLNLRLRFVSVF